MIYFAKFGNNIKVGYTKGLAERFKQHRRTYRPELQIEFLFAFEGDKREERNLHQQLKDRRVFGGKTEIFCLSDAELDNIRGNASSLPGFTMSLPKY